MARDQFYGDRSGRTRSSEIPRAVDNVRRFRMQLANALLEWRDAGGHIEEVADLIECLISAKIGAVIQAREDNRRAHTSSTEPTK